MVDVMIFRNPDEGNSSCRRNEMNRDVVRQMIA